MDREVFGGVALSVLGIVFTVMAQDTAGDEFDREFGVSPEASAEAAKDVTVSGCEIIDSGYGSMSSQAVVKITNNTDRAQSYWVTISLNDGTDARVGTINAISNSLAAGQSVTLSGMDASGLANEDASPGPSACTVADLDRIAS
ncbi:MAG: hypothetical protein ACRDUV_00920 [Pseudonocardiaceae bacterium]